MTDGADFSHALEALAAQGRLRELRCLPGAGARIVLPDGRALLNFSCNDYLALAGDPRLRDAACAAVQRWGCGATASRLMSGHLAPHAALEERLAHWMGAEAALVFGSGYLANLGLVTALVEAGAALFMDRLGHASLIDGARLAGARLRRYPHGDHAALEALLAHHKTTDGWPVVLTESVFSMDGDIAPLDALAEVCARHGARLVVDEAHALGIFGPRGAGCWPEARGTPSVLLARVGTLSKSLGSYGGFVAGSASLCRWLINRARGFIYSTGLAPACIGAAGAALDILEEFPDLGPTLRARAAAFREALRARGLCTAPSASPIVPVRVGDNRRALAVSRELETRGLLGTAVRPPTVPAGTARLRFSVTLGHAADDLEQAAATIAEVIVPRAERTP